MAGKSELHKRIIEYLGDKYQESDDELIDLYCKTRKLYDEMLAELRKDGFMVKHTNKAGATNRVKNPLAIEVTKTAQVLNQLLKSLGLTAAQRKKAGGVVDEEEDEFTNF